MKTVFISLTRLAFFLALALLWMPLGHAAGGKTADSKMANDCRVYSSMADWLESHATLDDWTRFYFHQHDCRGSLDAFLKLLATSEALSTKLNQARVTFDQFYVPLSHLLQVNWNRVDSEEMPEIQGDFMLLDISLKKVLVEMTTADADYFRATILIGGESDFVLQEERLFRGRAVSHRINEQSPRAGRRIHYREVSPLPFESAYLNR